MIVFIIDVVAAFLLCLYFANGKLVLFQKGGFGLWRSNRNQVLSEETTEENQGEVLMPRVSFRQRLGNFKSNPRLWIFGISITIVAFVFYVWRQNHLINAPLLNLKYMLLLFIFCAAAVVDLHYSIIPNTLVLTALGFWGALAVFTIIVEHNSVLTLLAYSGIGLLFGSGVLWLCRILMKGSMGFGDIKLMGVTGLICGFYKTFNILFYALVFAFIAGIVLIIGRKANRHATMPLAPFLLMGYLVAGFIGI